jgi:hypothetical protein
MKLVYGLANLSGFLLLLGRRRIPKSGDLAGHAGLLKLPSTAERIKIPPSWPRCRRFLFPWSRSP